MKTPKDNIFRLINAMTAAEKRYFKRHYSSEKNLLTELFDYINGMPAYKEETIKEHFSNSKLSKNLKVYKVQLSDLLLKSLASYHSKKSIQSKIRIGLEEANILFNKELFDLAQTKLERLKDLCVKVNANAQLLEVYCMEAKFNQILHPFGDRLQLLTTMDQWVVGHSNCLQWHTNLEKLNQFKEQLFPVRLNSHQREYCQRLLASMPNSSTVELAGFYKPFFWHRIKGTASFYLGNTEQGQTHFEILLQLFESPLNSHKRYEEYFLACLYDYIFFLIEYGIDNRKEQLFARLQNYFEKHPELKRNKLFLYLLRAHSCLRQRQFNTFTTAYTKQILDHVQTYQLEEHPASSSLFLRLALVSLIRQDPKQAHFFFRKLHLLKNHMSPVVILASDFLELISHYESGDVFLIKNWITAYRRKHSGSWNNPKADFPRRFAHFMNQLTKTPKRQIPELAKAFADQLEQFAYDRTFQILSVLGLRQWLEALVHQEPLAERFRLSQKKSISELNSLHL